MGGLPRSDRPGVEPSAAPPRPPARRAPSLAMAQGKVLAGTAVVLLAGLGAWLWHDATTQVRDDAATAAYAAARELAEDAAAVELVKLAALFPEASLVESWTGHGDAVAGGHEAFLRTAVLHGQERVRLIVPETEAGYGVPGMRQPLRYAATLSNRAEPRWLESVKPTEGLSEAWETGTGRHWLDEPGKRVISWAPVLDEHGHPVAVLELTRNVAEPLLAARVEAGLVFIAVLLVLAGAAWSLHGMAGRQDKLAGAVLAAVRRLDGGERSAPIAARDATTRALERLRLTLGREADVASRQIAELEARLLAAEALLDPTTTSRRKAIASRIGSHRLLVSLNEVLAEEATLLDLSYGLVHLRVGDITALDLAVGVPVQVGWNRERPSLVRLWVRRRIAGPMGTEYVLSGSPDLELPATPSALRAHAYPRKAARVPMLDSGATVRVLGDAPELQGVVLMDLSATGAQLLVQRPIEELVGRGTELPLELSLPGEANPIVVTARVREISELANATILRLEFDKEGEGLAGQRLVAAWVTTRLAGGSGLLSAA